MSLKKTTNVSISLAREDSRSIAGATEGGYKNLKVRIEELETEVLELRLRNEQLLQDRAVQTQLESFQIVLARVERENHELRAKMDTFSKDTAALPIWKSFEQQFSGIDANMAELRKILGEVRDYQVQIVNKVNDQVVLIQNQVERLKAKQSDYRKKEYVAIDIESKLRGVDWAKVLAQQEQKDLEFASKTDYLLKQIENKEWNLRKLLGTGTSLGPTSQNMSRAATPPRSLNVKNTQLNGLAFRHSDHLAEDMVNAKREPVSGGRLPPEVSLHASAVKIGKLSDRLADELGEEFNLELSRNSDNLAPGEARKKLGFDSQLPLTESLSGKPTLPPRVRISKIRGVEDRSNASMDQKTQSLNNSALNDSSRSRKRRQQTNVIIKGLTSSQFVDENETSKRVKLSQPREDRNFKGPGMQTFSLHSDDPTKKVPPVTGPSVTYRRSILQMAPSSGFHTRTAGSTPTATGTNTWVQDPIFSQLTSKLARRDAVPAQPLWTAPASNEGTAHQARQSQMGSALSDRELSERNSSRNGGPSRPKVLKFDIGSERVYSMHSQWGLPTPK